MKCIVCHKELSGKQQKYCSRKCHNQHGNLKFQKYEVQQKRALERKLSAIENKGGCCQICGYSRNLAALVFHHLDPTKKEFSLTAREFSNNSLDTLERELEKCQLLCGNCHMEIHYPHLAT